MDRAVEGVEGRVHRALGLADLQLHPVGPVAVAAPDPDRRRSAAVQRLADQLVDLAARSWCWSSHGRGDPVVEAAGADACLPWKTVATRTESARLTPAMQHGCGAGARRRGRSRSAPRPAAAPAARRERRQSASRSDGGDRRMAVSRLPTTAILRLPPGISMPEGDTIHRVAMRFQSALVGREIEQARGAERPLADPHARRASSPGARSSGPRHAASTCSCTSPATPSSTATSG